MIYIFYVCKSLQEERCPGYIEKKTELCEKDLKNVLKCEICPEYVGFVVHFISYIYIYKVDYRDLVKVSAESLGMN